jgi:ParB family chromosome partitioning protein
VRKQWLTGFLARKGAPKDAARYIAATLARGGHDVRKAMENAHPTACELLGLDAPAGCYSGKPNPISVALETAPAARLTVITLAVLLGAAEDATSRSSWRTPTSETCAYFSALAGWGYPLSLVEQLVCNPDGPAAGSAPTADEDPGIGIGIGTETETGGVEDVEDPESEDGLADEEVDETGAEVIGEVVTDAA